MALSGYGRRGRHVLRGHRRLRLTALATAVGLLAGTLPAVPVLGAPTELFFSEYVEGSSNNKALEIYNGTGADVDLGAHGYNVQMFFNGNTSALTTINLTGTVADGDVFVLADDDAVLPIVPDQTSGSSFFNGDDAIVLRKGTAVVDVIGQVGSDPGSEWGTGLESTADNTLRRKATVQAGDTDGTDAFDPAVEWNGFPQNTFAGLGTHSTVEGDAAPSVASTTPANGATGVPVDSDVAVTFSEPVTLASGAFALSCDDTGSHTVVATTTDDTTWTFDPDADFALDETCTATIESTAVTDLDGDDPPDQMAADHSFTFETASAPIAIHDVQGNTHISPRVGDVVTLDPGVVTAVSGNGFYLQAPDDDVDGDPATSEAIFVFTGSAPAVTVADEVTVAGRVTEFRPGGNSTGNLTTTEITSPTVTPLSEEDEPLTEGDALPAATVIGIGGRTPPTTVIEDDASGSVETSGVFDPAQDGIDFYESLEAMRVQVNDAVAVGPTNGFGEIAVLADNGAGAPLRTPRGGIVIRPTDFNPERIILDDVLAATPVVDVGDTFTAPIRGVMDYGFGNFKLQVTATPSTEDGGLEREVTSLVPGEGELTMATFNVENLDPGDGPTFGRLAGLIVDHLRSPDLIALEEVQDDNGAVNDSTTDASLTAAMLVSAIEAAGGPTYEYRDIDPVDDQDGGQPGGNIRVAFLFRTDRGLSFVDRPGGDPTTATTIVSTPDGPQLSHSPGRVDPNDPAFDDSRKPLAGEFSFNGQTIFVVANHFASKGGDDPLFGRFQPPTLHSEVQRLQQAAIVNDFAEAILAEDPNANIVVMGDLNDFQFSAPIQTVADDDLLVLIETLPPAERYTYVFDGNSQVLDHILVSEALQDALTGFDVVHINAEFADQASDHDPSIARFLLGVPTDKDDCKRGGWQVFTNPTFRNQGQCVSWVNHH